MGEVWGQARSPRAAKFIIVSLEEFPDEQLLLELKAGQRSDATPQLGDHDDLFAQWLLVDRGLRPLPAEKCRSAAWTEVYGAVINTHFGSAVLHGLRLAGFAPRSQSREDAGRQEARREAYDLAFQLALEHFHRGDWAILKLANNYDEGKGSAWRYLHPCISNYVATDMMDKHDPGVDIPGVTFRARFQGIVGSGGHRVAESDDEEGRGTSLVDLLSTLSRPSPSSGPTVEANSPVLQAVHAAIEKMEPVPRALLLLLHVPPQVWTDRGAEVLAKQLGTEPSALIDFLRRRVENLELLERRYEACAQLADHLERCIERTVESIREAYERKGAGRDEIDQQLEALKARVGPKTKQKDLPKAPRGSRAGSLEFLEPWLLRLLWKRQKMRLKAALYEDEMKARTKAFVPQELGELCSMTGLKRSQIKQALEEAEGVLREALSSARVHLCADEEVEQ